MSRKTSTKSICVAIPEELHQAGKNHARQEDISFSSLARRALRRYLNSPNPICQPDKKPKTP